MKTAYTLHGSRPANSRLSALCIALAAVCANAQETPRPDTSSWKCEQCPFARSYVADYEIGAAYVSEDSAPFGNGTGYDEEGAYAVASGSGDYANEAYRMRWELADLGLDARTAQLTGGAPGIYMYRLAYEELPYRRFDTAQTVFRRAGAESLALPADWVAAGTTAGFSALDASLVARDIGSDRRSFEAGGRFRGFDALRLSADYRRADRDGWRMAGAGFFDNSALLPVPFDDSTDTVDFAATYSGERWFAQLSWSASRYDNSNDALLWTSPFGNGPGALAQAPDSDAQVFALSGAYTLPARTVLSLTASIGEIKQDDRFLPYTVNPALATNPLPRNSLDGQVDTTHLDLRVTSSPWQFLRLKGQYRYDDRNNETPRAVWSRAITDLFASGEAEENRPYSFERSRLALSAQARLDRFTWLRPFTFEGGYERDETDRDLQEVVGQTEDSGWGRVRWRSAAGIDVALRAGASRREPDRYDTAVATALGQNPLLRKYTLAYRYRDFAQLRASFGWPDQGLAAGAEVYYASDDYTRSALGLRKSDDRRFVADLTWTFSDRLTTYLQGSYEDIEADVLGSESFADVDWRSQHRDRFRTLSAGVELQGPADRFDLRMGLVRAKGHGDVFVAGTAAGPGAYPQLQTDLFSATADFGYRLTAAIEVRLQLRYDDFSTSDWALQGVDPATLPTILTLGVDPYDDEVYLAALSVRYSFGRAVPAAGDAN